MRLGDPWSSFPRLDRSTKNLRQTAPFRAAAVDGLPAKRLVSNEPERSAP
jgi:hypothetical protein